MSQLPFSPGDQVFGYLRDSGHEEQELSVEQQERAFLRWAKDNQLIVSFVYKDEARKGSSTVGRAALQTMMHEFRRGTAAKGVVVWRYNRFARSVDNAQFYRAEIRTRGYIFYSLNDKVPEGPMGRLFEAAIDFKDEQFLLDLSEDVKRGLRNLVETYGCVPGGTPTGFLREPVRIGTRRDGRPHIAHRWKPDPAVARRILKAFELRSARVSLGEIQKKTKLFRSINSYTTFFSNPIYKGTLKFGDYIKHEYCKAIVPPELWDKVQAVQRHYSQRKHVRSDGPDHPRRANSRFLLSGISMHSICGSPLYGHSSKQPSGKSYDSYFCTRAYRNRDCVRHRIPRETLETAVVKALSDEILEPGYLRAVFEDLKKSQAGRLEKQEAEMAEKRAELTRTQKQIANVTDSLTEHGKSKALIARLQELELQESELQGDIALLEATAEQPVPEMPNGTMDGLARNFRAIYDKADLDTRRFLIRGLVDHVEVVREDNFLKGIIHFFYPPSLAPPSPSDTVIDNNVPITLKPSGPPAYRHIVSHSFKAQTKTRSH